MISLWIVYILLIALGDWFAIDSPIYTSIYSYFLIVVLVVTFFSLVFYRVYRPSDLRYLWYVIFAVTVVSQPGLAMGAHANNLYFALFFTATLPAVFIKTVFAHESVKSKATAFAAAFALMVATRLTGLLVLMWNNISQIYDLADAAWLVAGFADIGGIAHFITQIYHSAMELSAAIVQQAPLNQAAMLAYTVALDGITLLLAVAAAGFGTVSLFKRRKHKEALKQEAEEYERQEIERLEAEQEAKNRANQELLQRAKALVGAAQDGDVQAQHELGMLYLGAENYAKAVPNLQGAADRDYTESQFVLGKLYCKGAKGFEMDLGMAYDLLERAAESDHSEAQFLLGSMYFVSAGIDAPDYTQAAAWWSKAAANDHIEAMSRLAQLHTMADEFPEADAHLAIKLLKKLSYENGVPNHGIPIDMLVYNKPRGGGAENTDKQPMDRSTKRARADEIKAEIYWLNEGIKAKQKFLDDFADDWDWRNDATQKKINDDYTRIDELKNELEQLMKRKIV